MAVMGLTFCSCEESNMVVTESLFSKTEVDMETMEESQEETESPATLEADRSEDASNVSRTEALEISSGENKEMQNHETFIIFMQLLGIESIPLHCDVL